MLQVNNPPSGGFNLITSIRKNARHIALTLSIAVIVYFILYFVLLQTFVKQQSYITESVQRTEYVELKQDAMIKDLRKQGLETKTLDKAIKQASKTLIDK